VLKRSNDQKKGISGSKAAVCDAMHSESEKKERKQIRKDKEREKGKQ
jgi:hypothetical protein